MNQRLIVFTRYPEPGATKRRLIPALGPDGAAALQRDMTLYTLRWAMELCDRCRLSVEVRFTGGNESLMQACFGTEWTWRPQEGDGLGERMSHAFREAFLAGMQETVLVGTDCPGITAHLAQSAFEMLRNHDVVLGPRRTAATTSSASVARLPSFSTVFRGGPTRCFSDPWI